MTTHALPYPSEKSVRTHANVQTGFLPPGCKKQTKSAADRKCLQISKFDPGHLRQEGWLVEEEAWVGRGSFRHW